MGDDGDVDHKRFARPKWLTKPGSKAGSKDKARDSSRQLSDDVQDFLKPSTTKARSFAPKLAPKIDIAAAQRYPGAADVNPTPSSIKGRSARNRARLTVAWDDGAPVIMGYGGDDCEEPTAAISKAKADHAATQRTTRDATGASVDGKETGTVGHMNIPPAVRSMAPPTLKISTTTGLDDGDDDDDDDKFRSKSLQRAPTGFLGVGGEHEDNSAQSPISPTRALQQRMRREEGRMLHEVRRSQLLELPDELADLSLVDTLAAVSGAPGQPPPPGDSHSTADHLSAHRKPAPPPPPPHSSQTSTPAALPTSKHPQPHNIPPPPTKFLHADAIPAQPVPRAGPPSVASHHTPSPSFHSRLSPGYREEYQTPPGVNPLSFHGPHAPPASLAPRSPAQAPAPAPSSQALFSTAKIEQEEALSQLTPDSAKASSSASADMALLDFSNRIGHMRRIFPLTAEREAPIASFSAKQWLRAAVWWFLRARQRFEELIRARAKSPASVDSPGTQQLDQGHVDLGKTFWILEDVLPSHKQLQQYMSIDDDSQKAAAQAAGDTYAAAVISESSMLRGQVKLLASSMARNKLMPPHEVLIQGLDQLIWIRYPKLPFPEIPSIAMTYLGDDFHPFDDSRVLFTMSLADTQEYFNLHRCFALTTIDPDYRENVERREMPTLLTILRRRGSHNLKLTLATQNDTINFIYEDELPWDLVIGFSRSKPEMRVALPPPWPEDSFIMITLSPSDFSAIRKVHDSTYSAAVAIQQQENESLLYQGVLREFYFKYLSGPSHPNGPPPHQIERPSIYNFPSGSFPHTSIHIFGVYTKRIAHSGEYRNEAFSGFRIAVTTAGYKGMNTLSLTFPTAQPEHLGSYTDSGGLPVLVMFHYGPSQTRGDLVLSFRTTQEREHMLEVMRGFYVQPGEQILAEIPLDAFDLEEAETRKRHPTSGQPPWSRLTIIQSIRPDNSTYPRLVFNSASQGYRITLTDRFTDPMSQLKFRLVTELEPRIEFFRPDPRDLSCTIERTDPSTKVGPEWSHLLHATSSPTIRSYTFPAMSDLHTFEAVLTGFAVKYDCVPQSFTLSRPRRSALAFTRQAKSTPATRLQILEQLDSPTYPPHTLLLAFITAGPPAPYLAIPLRPTDAFERLDPHRLGHVAAASTGGKYAIKLPNAQFGLPTAAAPSAHRRVRSHDTSPRHSAEVRPDTAHSNAPGGGGPPSLAGSQMSGGSGARGRESGFLEGIGAALTGRHDTAAHGPGGAGEVAAGYVNLAELPIETEREEVVIGFAEREERGRLWAVLPGASGQADAGAEEVEEGGRWERERERAREKRAAMRASVVWRKDEGEEEGKRPRFWRREKD